MEYTDKQKLDFKRQFAIIRRRQAAITVLPLFIILLCGAAIHNGLVLDKIPVSILALIIFFVSIGGVVLFFVNFRCPACKKFMMVGKATDKGLCPNCGIELR